MRVGCEVKRFEAFAKQKLPPLKLRGYLTQHTRGESLSLVELKCSLQLAVNFVELYKVEVCSDEIGTT